MSTLTMTCPEWCIADHSDYTNRSLELGDVIRHKSDELLGAPNGSTFTIAIDGEDPSPFSVRRVKQVLPDGTVLFDGYDVGERFMAREEALSLFEDLHRKLERHQVGV
jgi:hypothetical protein